MSAAAGDLTGALAALVGEDHVRRGGDAGAVAGVPAGLAVSPGDEDEVAAVLRACAAAGAGVVVRGGGTASDWGAPPRRADVVLETGRLAGIVDHAAGDMVCVVRAGTRLGELQAALAGGGQRLALDPPRPGGATVGGILATDHAGGLRHRHGTPRDLLIGARFVLADGTIGSSGGRVVKNVAGYDVGRLLAGSLGSLAVLVEAAFKLHPLSAASATVVLADAPASRLAVAAAAAAATSAPLAALDVHWPQSLLVARLEGTATGVEAGAEAVAAAIGGEVLDAAAAAVLEADLALRPWEGEGLIAGIGVPVGTAGALLEACSDFAVEAVVRAGAGAAEARLPVDGGVLDALRAAVGRLGGHVSLRRGGSRLPEAAWPPGDPVAVDLARAVKRALDPSGTLAAGRRQGGV